MPLTAGTRLGPYEIAAALGAGGMGEVYRARDTRLDRDVAVKVLPQAIANDSGRLRRFEQEARAAAALNHPGILALYDVGCDGGTAFMVTELLEGRSLREVLRGGHLAVSRVVELAAQIADGLAATHALNLVHRDVKPENIFITSRGHAKILDFGLATSTVRLAGPMDDDAATRSATEPYTVLGTAGYTAPEQVRGQAVDHRADLFAFGAVLYEMVTGRRAFGGSTGLDRMTAVLHESPAPIVTGSDRPVPPALVWIVERCLEKVPASRFQSTSDLAFALRSVTVRNQATCNGKRRSTRVLVVEDEPNIAFALEADLQTEGYATTAAATGPDALAAAQVATFDLILLDVMLPGKDGYDVCRELRRSGVRTPIILLTAKTHDAEKVLGLDLGADDYVTKPFNPHELRARIRAALRRAAVVDGQEVAPDFVH